MVLAYQSDSWSPIFLSGGKDGQSYALESFALCTNARDHRGNASFCPGDIMTVQHSEVACVVSQQLFSRLRKNRELEHRNPLKEVKDLRNTERVLGSYFFVEEPPPPRK